MGPKRAIAKMLFDEDGDYLDQFDPRKMMDEDPAESGSTSGMGSTQPPSKPRRRQPGMNPEPPAESGGGGFSWTDVT